MKINKLGIELIKKYEGYSARIYTCVAGMETIGYGHLIKNEMPIDWMYGNSITKEQAEELLRRDLIDAENAVEKLVRVDLTDNQFSSLVSFTFNLGGVALKGSTLLRKINKGKLSECVKLEECTKEFIKWIHAGKKKKVKIKGLLKRRVAEALLFIS